LVAGAGFEPQGSIAQDKTEPVQNDAKSTQNNALDSPPVKQQKQNSTDSIHSNSTSLHPKCVPDVYQNDLAKVVAAWDSLSPDARRHIVDIVAQRK
jgi:hypothetical protein